MAADEGDMSYSVYLGGAYRGFGTLDDIRDELRSARHDMHNVFICLVYAAVVFTIWVVWQMIRDCAYCCMQEKPRPQIAAGVPVGVQPVPAPVQYQQGVAVVGNAPAGPTYTN